MNLNLPSELDQDQHMDVDEGNQVPSAIGQDSAVPIIKKAEDE